MMVNEIEGPKTPNESPSGANLAFALVSLTIIK